MPTYLYECDDCGEFEVSQPISEPAFQSCPECGSGVRRIISGGTGFIIRGTGTPINHCEKESPCCGRQTRCDKPPCEK